MKESAAWAAGFGGLHSLLGPRGADAAGLPASGYGRLVADPRGMLDLPDGFSYQVVSRVGRPMADGLFVPAKPDGMAAFAGPDGTTLLMRNHECLPADPGPTGDDPTRLTRLASERVYDAGRGPTPASGGVTTVVYDTRRQAVVREFLTLGGTISNCAGGPTPWGTWITCEETVDRVGETPFRGGFTCDADHGYCFETPAAAGPGPIDARPLRALGRFRHEAVAVLAGSGIVYLTEDMDDGAFYRFLPETPGDLHAGGRLQALALRDEASVDARNWPADGGPTPARRIATGERLAVRWIDLDDVESPHDDLRHRAFAAGAARFARGEGCWNAGGRIVFACTSGGAAQIGQLWRYTPSGDEGRSAEADRPGVLELFLEPNDSRLVENADNLTAAPWGDLIVCEDRDGPEVRLVGVTPEGRCYEFARNHQRTEFAGVCFSPDGSTLFVNLQHVGLTVAITGPWRPSVA